ncbi:MAG: amino acid decarboxylase [Nonomuraea sp.]|nr:amino acid decarboxylase [Nonomuraea sp.]
MHLEPDPQTARAMGEELAARIADYLTALPKAPASRFGESGPSVARMLQPPPERAGDFGALLDAFEEAASHGLDTSGPGYLCYFPAGGLVSAVLADAYAQLHNRYASVAHYAPALVAMEDGVLRWFATGLFGMPAGASGLVTTGGSLATLSALVTARYDRLGEDLTGARLYVTEHTHFCVAKAARIAGLPASAVRVVPTRELRMDVEAAAAMIAADRAAGLRPFLLVGTGGTTSTGTVDPLVELGELAVREDVWFHVDAAYGGGLCLTDRGRARLAGIAGADSIAFDPHKSLFLQYGTGVLLVREPRKLREAHADTGDYLQDLVEEDGLPDYGHLGPELTREFRGLRLWLPLHLHGVAAFRAALEEKLDLARLVHEELAGDPRFEVPWEPDLTVVAFRLRGDDAANRRLLERVNAGRRVFLSSTMVEGRFFLRMNPTSHRTHEQDVRAALTAIREGV